jgi:hypothetical protein
MAVNRKEERREDVIVVSNIKETTSHKRQGVGR